MVIANVALVLLQVPPPLLTVMVTEYVPAVVGVPEMMFRFDPLPCVTPGGSVPVTV